MKNTYRSVLVHSGCHDKNSINAVVYKGQKCVAHSSEGWKSKINMLVEQMLSAQGQIPSLHTVSFHCVLTRGKE